jgi:hypothetical protein
MSLLFKHPDSDRKASPPPAKYEALLSEDELQHVCGGGGPSGGGFGSGGGSGSN